MEDVTIIVKAPNQQFEDQTIKCEISWTIERLKAYLSEVYPNKPKSDEQKLIYSGKLLRDNAVLRDVLRQYEGQDTHTVHLVFTPKHQHFEPRPPAAAAASTAPMSAPTPPAAAAADASAANGSTAPTNPSAVEPNVLRQRTTNGVQPVIDQALYNAQLQQHYLMAQQYAMQQYLMAQQQQLAAIGTSTDPAVQQQAAAAAAYQTAIMQQQWMAATLFAQQQQQQQQQAVAAQPAPVAPAAAAVVAAVAANDDDHEPHDWLEIFYNLCRLMLMLAMIIVYTSPKRILAVVMIFACFQAYRYLTEMNELNRQRARAREREAAANNAAGPAAAADDAAAAPANGEAAESDAAPTAETTVANVADRTPAMALVRTFILSFFSSLFPDNPYL